MKKTVHYCEILEHRMAVVDGSMELKLTSTGNGPRMSLCLFILFDD